MRIAPSIHRVGGNSAVNAYLIKEAGEVTIIDAAMPGLYRDLVSELATMGSTLAD